MKLRKRLLLFYIRTKFKILSSISKKKAARAAFELFCTPPTRNEKIFPEIFRQAEQLDFDFDKYRIVGYRWNANGGRKALILHGFESSAVNFGFYVEELIKKGYEVLAFDAPAHGRSSGKRITALIYRDLVKHINEKWGPVKSWVGHSLGGFVLCLALAEIDHDSDHRVALVAPSTETSTAIKNFFNTIRLDEKVQKEFENHILMLSGRPISWFSINRTMEQMRAQILWIHDEDDLITPLEDALKVRAVGHSRLKFIVTRGLGHSRIYRDAEVGRTIVDFL